MRFDFRAALMLKWKAMQRWENFLLFQTIHHTATTVLNYQYGVLFAVFTPDKPNLN